MPVDKRRQEQHWLTIFRSYGRSRFVGLYRDFFEEPYQKDIEYLWQVDEEIIPDLLRCFDINVKVPKASELDMGPKSEETDLKIAQPRSVGADICLPGPSGRNYLELEKSPRSDIGLRFFTLQHPVCRRRHRGSESAMSAIDLPFKIGPRASEIIKTPGELEGLELSITG